MPSVSLAIFIERLDTMVGYQKLLLERSMKPIWLLESKICMTKHYVTIVMDGEMTHDFTDVRLNDDQGIESVLWGIDAKKDVHMFIDGVEYSLPPPDMTCMKPTSNQYGYLTIWESWQIKTLRDHLKHCLDIHKAFHNA